MDFVFHFLLKNPNSTLYLDYYYNHNAFHYYLSYFPVVELLIQNKRNQACLLF